MKGKKRLFLAMGIYAILFLILTGLGLSFLWKYMEAYEASRPKYAVDAYLEQLSPERILQNAPGLPDTLDEKLQDQEAVLSFLKDLLETAPTAGKTGSGDTYSVRCQGGAIGSFTLAGVNTGPYGLPVWTVEEESYDLSRYFHEPVTITVPSGYHVLAGGMTLDDGYITQRNIPYDVLEPFYSKLELPVMTAYTVPAVLGEIEIQVTDESGEAVPDDSGSQWVSALDNCTEAEEEQLNDVLQAFLTRYVAFAGSRAGSEKVNFYNLANYLVPGGDLVNRLRSALDGLSYGQSRGNDLSGWEKNLFTRIDDTHYFCDITYHFAVVGTKGTVDTEENLKVILTETNGKLLVEALDNY